MFNEKKILKRFMEYVRIGSEIGNEMDFYKKLIEDLKRMGAEIYVDNAGASCDSNANNIYATFSGDLNNEPLIFSCHMDTVKPGINIEPVIEDGLIKSKGNTILGSDDKAGITALVEAMEELKKQNLDYGPIQMVFTIDEEVGFTGSKNLEINRLIGKRCYVLDSSGPVGKIIVQAPGSNIITAKIMGRPAHAGIAPEKGISALMAGADAISNMNLLRIDDETTANIGTFEAVCETNIVSPEARIIGEIRSLSMDKLEKQTVHMEECLRKAAKKYGAEIEISIEKLYEPYSFDENNDIVNYVKDSCKKIGIKPFTALTGGGSDANIFNKKGIASINLGCGINDAHTTEESIEVKSLIELTELAYNLIIGR